MDLKHETRTIAVMGLFGLGGLAGCGGAPDEPDWQYDQADMEAAVFGTWEGTITPTEGETAALIVTIRSHDDIARSPACGSRSFSDDDATRGLGVRCITSSTLAVSATVVGDGAEPEEADGDFMVFGESLLAGELSLDYRSFDARWMWARWDDPGVWAGCEFGSTVASDEFAFATCTLDERVDVTE